MKKISKNIKLLSLLIFSIFFMCSCRNNDSKQTLKKINVTEPTRTVFYCPQYIADSCGFFEEEGLKVEIKTANGSDKSMTALLSGGAEISLLGVESAVYVYNEGKENSSVLFAQLTKKDGSFLVGRSKDFNSWNDLKGKSLIAGRIGGMPNMCLEHVLKEKGIYSNVELLTNIQFDIMSAAFSSGVGDYVMLFEPLASSFEQDKGFHILHSLGEDCGEIAYTCYCAQKSYINKNPEIIKKFTNAIYKAQKWLKQHSSDEIIDMIFKYFPDADKFLLLKAVENYKAVGVWSETPAMKKEQYDLAQMVAIEAGQINKKIEMEKVYDGRFAEAAIENS